MNGQRKGKGKMERSGTDVYEKKKMRRRRTGKTIMKRQRGKCVSKNVGKTHNERDSEN